MSTGRIMVDELVQPLNARHRCFAGGACHLTTDGDLEQLHAFARRLGLKRAWFQPHPLHPHYDLTASKRRRALEMGAVFVPAREQATARLRARGVLPTWWCPIGCGAQIVDGVCTECGSWVGP